MKRLTSLATRLAAIDRAFLQRERSSQTDLEVANAALEWILKRERVRHRVDDRTDAAKQVDMLTISRMKQWDSNDPAMSTTEKILRRLAEGRGEDAIVLVRALQEKAQAVSSEMQRRAKAPRKQHPINELLENLVRTAPRLSEKIALRKLTAMAGGDVVAKVTNEYIEPYDTTFPNVSVSGLKNRLNRIKHKVSR